MSLLRSNELKVYLKDGESYSDISQKMRTFEGESLSHVWDSYDSALIIGFRHRFNHRYFNITTGHDGSATLAAQYFNGTAWASFEDVTDETEGFSRSGFIVWKESTSWASSRPQDIPSLSTSGIESATKLYWLKLTLDTSSTAPLVLEAVKFILSDDRSITSIYPEIMRYLPDDQTNFLRQHELAKDAIVTTLKVAGLIDYEDQIKDPDDWFMAASYKCVETILLPISGDERVMAVKTEMAAQASKYIGIGKAKIDRDKSQHLEDRENPETASPSAGSTQRWFTR